MVGILDVIATERDRIRADLALQQYELDRDLARIDLSRAVGRGDDRPVADPLRDQLARDRAPRLLSGGGCCAVTNRL